MNQQRNFSIVKNRTIEEKAGKVLKSDFHVFPEVRKTNISPKINALKDGVLAEFYERAYVVLTVKWQKPVSSFSFLI